MSHAQMLADYVRAGGPHASSHLLIDSDNRTHLSARFGGLAAHIENLSDDDPRLIEMDLAGYFATGHFIPGPQAEQWMAGSDPAEDWGPLADFCLSALAGHAMVDKEKQNSSIGPH